MKSDEFDDLKAIEEAVDVLTKDTPEALGESPAIPEILGVRTMEGERAHEAIARTPETPQIPGDNHKHAKAVACVVAYRRTGVLRREGEMVREGFRCRGGRGRPRYGAS